MSEPALAAELVADLAAELAADRPRRRAVARAAAVVAAVVIAAAVAGPLLWHSVRSEPSASIAVPSLPSGQPSAATQLPLERAPAPAAGQVASLGRFTARDPFAPRTPEAQSGGAVTPPGAASAGSAAVAPGATPAVTPGAAAAPGVTPAAPPGTSAPAATSAPSATPAPGTTTAPAATPAPATSAGAAAAAAVVTIEVNGVPAFVTLQARFPTNDPLFQLVALGADRVQIAVAAGGAASQSVTLIRGRTLTLLDTTSGARYQLRLLALPVTT